MGDVLSRISDWLLAFAEECEAEEGPDHCAHCVAWALWNDLEDFRKADTPVSDGFPVTFGSEQEINRVAYLIHRDLARTLGNIQLSKEKLDEAHDSGRSLPGNQRRKAAQVLQSAPEQAEVLRGAQKAVQQALVEARKRGQIG